MNTLLTNEEKAIFNLRSLYEGYGYNRFKMSKFEEYDLYARNKDFLISDSVITFNDADGKLLRATEYRADGTAGYTEEY